MRRQTIQTPITVSGKGLHTGTASSVCLRPKLDDAAGWTINQIPLQECHILSSRLATKIGVADHTVSTTEHLFAALVGLGITDIHIETTDHEIPILDGSSKVWFEKLTPISLDSEVKPLRITQKLNINNGDAQLSMTPSDTYSAKITVDFDGYAQEYFEGDMRHFKEAMGARTFGYVDELETLQGQGVGLGADATNVLALYRFNEPPIEQQPKRGHELAKHKWLDLIGDLALVGRPIIGRVESFGGGHRINHSLVHQLRELAW